MKRKSADLEDVEDLEEVEEVVERSSSRLVESSSAVNFSNPPDQVLFELHKPTSFAKTRRFALENFIRLFAPQVGVAPPGIPDLGSVSRSYAASLSGDSVSKRVLIRQAELSGELQRLAYYEYDRLLKGCADEVMAKLIEKQIIGKPSMEMRRGGMAITFDEGELGVRKPF